MAFELMKELVRAEKAALKKIAALEADVGKLLTNIESHYNRCMERAREMESVTGGRSVQTPNTRSFRQAKMKTQGFLKQIEKLHSAYESEADDMAMPAKKVRVANERLQSLFDALDIEWSPKLEELRAQIADRLKVPLTPAASSRGGKRSSMTAPSFAERKRAYMEKKWSVDLDDHDENDDGSVSSEGVVAGADEEDDPQDEEDEADKSDGEVDANAAALSRNDGPAERGAGGNPFDTPEKGGSGNPFSADDESEDDVHSSKPENTRCPDDAGSAEIVEPNTDNQGSANKERIRRSASKAKIQSKKSSSNVMFVARWVSVGGGGADHGLCIMPIAKIDHVIPQVSLGGSWKTYQS